MAERRTLARQLAERSAGSQSERRRREPKADADPHVELTAVTRTPSERRKRERTGTA